MKKSILIIAIMSAFVFTSCKENAAEKVSEEIGDNEFLMFPNPANDLVNISFNNTKIKTVEILDNQGRLVHSVKVNSTFIELGTSDLASGLYTVRAISEDDRVFTQLLELIKN